MLEVLQIFQNWAQADPVNHSFALLGAMFAALFGAVCLYEKMTRPRF